MKKKFIVKQRRPMFEINIVPYVDVMLVLLVIFMATTPIIMQGVQVKLPQSSAKSLQLKQDIPIIVTVDRSGNFYLNIHDFPKKIMNAHDLLLKISAEVSVHRSRLILVKADSRAAYQQVINCINLLKSAGVGEIGLITEKSKYFQSKHNLL